MKVHLVVVQGKPEGKTIVVTAPKFVIGRGEQCHLRPSSDMVSKMHCSFVTQGNKVTLQDLGSTNGTHVNGDRIDGVVELKDGDLVKVGPLVFATKIQLDAPVKVAAPAAKPAAPDDDEFDIMQFLSDEEGAMDSRPTPPSLDSTVFEFKLPESAKNQDPGEAKKYNEVPPTPAEKPKDTAVEAADAAKALLNQMRVRKRT